MEEQLELHQIFNIIKKRFKLLVLFSIIPVLIAGILSFYFLTPVYEMKTQILVNQAKDEQQAYNFNEVQTNLQLINTYNVIIKSPAILDLVVNKMGLDLTTQQLNEKITVETEKNSQVVLIKVKDENPQVAVDIANQVATVFKKEIVDIMSVDNVSILSKAGVTENMSPVSPKPYLNMAIALVLGLFSGVGFVFLREYMDNTVKNDLDIEKHLQIPVLGMISIMNEDKDKKKRGRKNNRKIAG